MSVRRLILTLMINIKHVQFKLKMNTRLTVYCLFFLQIFRALRIPITSRMLSEILSRLIETVAEQGEDMQVSVRSYNIIKTVPINSMTLNSKTFIFNKKHILFLQSFIII